MMHYKDTVGVRFILENLEMDFVFEQSSTLCFLFICLFVCLFVCWLVE